MYNTFKMLQTRMASTNGFTVIKYKKGEVYEGVCDSVARYFYTKGWAEKIENDHERLVPILDSLEPLPTIEIKEI